MPSPEAVTATDVNDRRRALTGTLAIVSIGQISAHEPHMAAKQPPRLGLLSAKQFYRSASL
jgi:hypothetical protein